MADCVLYSTDHCQLCERALDLLLTMPELNGRTLTVIDVADDDALLTRYGERLPVLRLAGAELDWPFDAAAVRALIAS